MTLPDQESNWVPRTSEERGEVQAQLARLLADPLFSQSKRYPNFLRYLVEQSLAGQAQSLRERTIGVAIFGRKPDYDTAQDTIVRLTAAEVRKRIAQYYYEPTHRDQLQINLHAGSYVPTFIPARIQESPPEHIQPSATTPDHTTKYTLFRQPYLWIAIAVSVLVISTYTWRHLRALQRERQNPVHQFWAPLLDDSAPVEVVIADPTSPALSIPAAKRSPDDTPEKLVDVIRTHESVNFRDSLALNGITNTLAAKGKRYMLRLSSEATYTELQNGPSVLIGGLDNVWTMRITANFRYHFSIHDGTYRVSIADSNHPDQDKWSVDLSQSQQAIKADYALIARVYDPTTGHLVLIAAGIGSSGTAAAARFLLDPDRIHELVSHAPGDWAHRNVEAVVTTPIIDGREGPPQLVDTYFW